MAAIDGPRDATAQRSVARHGGLGGERPRHYGESERAPTLGNLDHKDGLAWATIRSYSQASAGAGSSTPLSWKASSALWYFEGEQHRNPLPTETTLTADTHPAGRFAWHVVDGADKVELGSARGAAHVELHDENRVAVRSKSGSSGEDDVRIEVTRRNDNDPHVEMGEGRLGVRTPVALHSAGSSALEAAAYPVGDEAAETGELQPGLGEEETEAMALPESAPKSLRHTGRDDNPDATWGYETHENYEVLDDKGNPIKGFDINENWTTAPVNDDPKCDWRRGAAGGAHSGSTTFFDKLQGEISTKTPKPHSPQKPPGGTKVQHWGQEWYIGSTTPGKGTKVQTDTLQKYQDHAAHESIKSPP